MHHSQIPDYIKATQTDPSLQLYSQLTDRCYIKAQVHQAATSHKMVSEQPAPWSSAGPDVCLGAINVTLGRG